MSPILLDRSTLLDDSLSLDELQFAALGDSGRLPTGRVRMYAIAIDLDTAQLQSLYPAPSYNDAYADIRQILIAHGFTLQQGSVYFGGEDMDAVQCVLAVQAVSKAHPWFKSCVRNIRMLRIEELNDLGPAL